MGVRRLRLLTVPLAASRTPSFTNQIVTGCPFLRTRSAKVSAIWARR